MAEQPVYEDIFEYIFGHYEIKIEIEEEAKKHKEKIYTSQYGFEDGPISPREKELNNAAKNTSLIKSLGQELGADMVGIAEVKREHFFKGCELEHKFSISLAMEMDYDRIEESPGPPSATEVIRVYCALGELTIELASRIREMGYSAFAHHPRASRKLTPRVLHIPVAIEAGLGELGRHGLLITPEYGPRVRLGTVTTDLPLMPDAPISFGATEYCENCKICVESCEGSAIPEERSMTRGVVKYTVDPYKCVPYFGEYDGCSVCMKVCPFNKPNR